MLLCVKEDLTHFIQYDNLLLIPLWRHKNKQDCERKGENTGKKLGVCVFVTVCVCARERGEIQRERGRNRDIETNYSQVTSQSIALGARLYTYGPAL